MLLFALILGVLIAVAQEWSLRHALDGVNLRAAPARRLVEPEEVFPLVTTVTNHSRRFLPFVRASLVVPAELTPRDDRAQLFPRGRDHRELRSSLWLMPRQTWRQELPVSFARRGRYVLTDATLYAGGFLGVGETLEYVSQFQELVVMPARCGGPGLDTVVGGFLGDRSVDRFLLEDPVLTLGFREYTGREPLKTISWTQSARTGRLMVKKYDYTLELTATVLLNIDTAKTDGWEERLERCFSLARTVCETLEEKRIPYRFVTNADAVGGRTQWSRVSDGLGNHHLSAILEGLGRATYEPLWPFEQTLAQCALHAEQGRTHILITPERQGMWAAELRQLEQRCGSRALILTAEEATDL